jgi:hypothetical protein
MRSVLILCACLLTALACRKTDPAPTPPRYEVDAAVEPYVRRFVEEAQKRGKSVDATNLVVKFDTLMVGEACGVCRLTAGEPPTILLNVTGLCWKTASAEAREGLVFHELGHCLLKRVHKNTLLPNGLFASLMNSEDTGVYAPCVYPIGADECDKRPRRPYYLDELFDERTPVPVWGR